MNDSELTQWNGEFLMGKITECLAMEPFTDALSRSLSAAAQVRAMCQDPSNSAYKECAFCGGWLGITYAAVEVWNISQVAPVDVSAALSQSLLTPERTTPQKDQVEVDISPQYTFLFTIQEYVRWNNLLGWIRIENPLCLSGTCRIGRRVIISLKQ